VQAKAGVLQTAIVLSEALNGGILIQIEVMPGC
jgi:hypothetical protein